MSFLPKKNKFLKQTLAVNLKREKIVPLRKYFLPILCLEVLN